MIHVGKRYRADAEKVKEGTVFPLAQAIDQLKAFKALKFDQSVDICLHLGIDTKQAEQSLRGAVALPHGVGKSKRVIAFVSEDKADDAKAAGAVEAGAEDLVKKVEAGWMEFDVAIASPDMMRIVSKLGKVLGPRGLMPSPKAGTVTPQVQQAVREYAAGKVEFRNDAGGNIHAVVGKFSFPPQKLIENITAFVEHMHRLKPATTKGQYIKKITIKGTMTPGVFVQLF